mgnify:CR=1 FL=1
MNKNKIIIDYLRKIVPKHIYNNDPYRVLVSCVLSQRARDETTEKVSKALLEIAPTAKDLAKLDIKTIEKTIRSIGFFKQKAKRLRKIGEILTDKKVPNTLEELIKLPGVGRKTANVVLCYGFGQNKIPIDTHCNRIPKRLGLVDEKASLLEVEKKLEELFDKKDWRVLNLGFVTFGKTICRPIKPLCSECPFKDFCKYYKEKFLD